jgi:AraC-like DNA-binding protein
MDNDPFSDFLKLTNAQPVITGGFTAGGPWAIRFPQPDKIKFFAMVKGHCWLDFEEKEERIRVDTGDVLLLSAQRTFVLAGDLPAKPIDAETLFSGLVTKTAKLGDGADCTQIGGHVRLDPVSGGTLANILPPLIHVRSTSPQAPVLRWLMDQLVLEREAGQPGANLSSAHLAQLIFVQILRAHLDTSNTLSAGWLRAAGDRRLAPALRLMHAEPARSWHLEDLARACAMSRTTFAQYFKVVAGVAPLTYLTNWRMMLAERTLREESTPVSSLAQTFGYASESAFSTAFKRVWGKSPRHYRHATESYADAGSRSESGPVIRSSRQARPFRV